ncbi:hypothetical protein LINGRAHAP2_LOCUS30027 [Linum grandiflorum]
MEVAWSLLCHVFPLGCG